MKIKITQNQSLLLKDVLNEARVSPIPTNLSSEFKKHPNLMYFSVNGKNSEYMFKVFNENGFVEVKDLNPGTRTRNCKGQANLDTMLYNDEFNFTCGGNNLKINNVNQIKLFDENPTQIGSIPVDTQSTIETSQLADNYEDSLRKLNNGDELFIDSMGSRSDYNGVIFNKTDYDFFIEVSPDGNDSKKFKLKVLDDVPVFYDENGKVWFKSITTDGKSFEVAVKRFETKISGQPKPEQPEQPEKEPEEADDEELPANNDQLLQDANTALAEIHKDKDLQAAFYRKPGFMELVMAELKNQQATGSGIVPLIQIVSKYGFNKLVDKLGNIFNKKSVLFTAYQSNIVVPYKTKTGVKNFIINQTHPKEAWLKSYQIGESEYVLENKYEKFKILVKEETDVEDVYQCDVVKNNEKTDVGITTNTEENVMIRFLRTSEGYIPKTKR